MDKKEIQSRINAAEKRVEKVIDKGRGTFIGGLISLVIITVVTVNVLPAVRKAIGEAKDKVSPGEAALLDTLPIMLVVVTVLGAVAWFWSSREGKYEEVEELSDADEIRQLQKKKRSHIIYRPVEET